MLGLLDLLVLKDPLDQKEIVVIVVSPANRAKMGI
jgi:hypothetical protein